MTRRDPTIDTIDPFLLMAALYLSVGFLALVGRFGVEAGLLSGLPRPRWTTIHLVTIGGLTQALFGALPRLIGVGDGARVGGRSWLRWLAVNGGFPLVLIGMTTPSTPVAVAGATLVLGAIVLLGRSVARAGRTDWAFRLAPWFLAVGILAALGILAGVHGPGGYFGSLEAHVHANVWGFLGLTVAGALSLLVPRIVDEPLPRPRWRRGAVWGIAIGAAGLVAGPWLALAPVTFSGLAIYLVGTGLLLGNVVGAWREAAGVDARLAHLLGAYLWLLFPVPWAPFVLLAPELVAAGAIERAAIDGLVFGWMLQLAAAFLPVVVVWSGSEGTGVDEAAAAVETPGWIGPVAINAGVLALWVVAMPPLDGLGDALTLAGLALVAVGWARFLVTLWGVVGGNPVRGGQSAGPSLDVAEVD